MEMWWSVWFFILGTVLASFGSVVGYRLPKKMKVMGVERSQCDHCERKLSWYERFPIISYLVTGGKCRTCKKRIPVIYTFVELATGGLYAFSYLKYGFSVDLLLACSLILLCAIIFVSDLLYFIISDKVLIVFFVWFLMLQVLFEYRSWLDAIAGGLLGFCFLLLLAILSKGGIGGGDIKLMGVLGLLLGFQGAYLTLMIASVIGVLIAIVGLLAKKYNWKTAIPFGPYLAVGALVTFYYSVELLERIF
ncbi:prepilin peptidase [Fictibacillus phosphorivorans]|uniref:prepilin peptidase n=1 Tax=Fictibacillus phosphorivorans TaxID=1221500 RepID=UPI002041191B|nr:A24 family peptidase [Fictibacillus phosphorivorans]MCM3719814.1 prepilin peptidase [Fictibacillus phosphorivorans]MCM3777515.1 prepilin peptidase [Fictibacillus phosphorivorans]